jgi:hypothetical protein
MTPGLRGAANKLSPVAPSDSLPLQGSQQPNDLDANRDLAEQLLGKTLGPARVTEARGHEVRVRTAPTCTTWSWSWKSSPRSP